MIKRIAIREELNLEARVDVSNLTNTPQFDKPLTNMATPSAVPQVPPYCMVFVPWSGERRRDSSIWSA